MSKNIKTVIFLLMAGYLTLILTGVKQYILWQQVVDYHNGVFDPDPLESGLVYFLHAPRYVLTWPAFYLSEKFASVDANVFFGIEIFAVVLASWLFLCFRRPVSTRSFGILLALVAICSLMNGRLVFAIFSASGLIFIDRRLLDQKTVKGPDLVAWGLLALASTVSSGAILMFAVMSASLFYRHRDLFTNRAYRIFLSALMLIVGLFLSAAAVKVYVYYGQGAEALREILSHGLGGHSSYFLTGMVAAAACVLTGIRLVKSRCGFAYAMVFFGLSSLVMSWGGLAYVVPAAMALFNDSCLKRRLQGES